MRSHCRKMMEQIKTPDALKSRVMNAACAMQSPAEKRPRHQSKGHTIFRAAACVACAAILLSGGLVSSKAGIGRTNAPKGAGNSLSTAYHFGLVAYAADIDESYVSQDNKIAFSVSSSGGGEIPGKGDYTGCLFRVTGEGIKTVNASIDRGGFYRYNKLMNLTQDEINALYSAEGNGTLKADAQFNSSDGKDVWCSEQVTALGSSFTENWTADGSYGFWVPPELIRHGGNEDLQATAHKAIDTFNGATLTITATFYNGAQQTKTLHLKTGKLKEILNDDHTRTVLPELATGDEPYVYSVYAELKNH